MNLLDAKTITIPTGTAANPGRVVLALPGEQFLCWSASAQFQLQFDNQPVCTVAAGWKIPTTWTQLTFLNPNNYPINVTFFYGSNNVQFSGVIQSQNLPTYAFGNLGLSASGMYQGQAVTITANPAGFIQLALGASLTVYGINNGNARKTIIFSIASNSAGTLIVNDLAGNNFCRVGLGAVVAFDTQAGFILTANTGTVTFNIGELYYSA